MTTQFTLANIELLLEALRYAKQAFEAYPYPTAQLRADRLAAIDDATEKLRDMRRDMKKAPA